MAAVACLLASVSWTRLPLSLDMWNCVSVSVALVLLT